MAKKQKQKKQKPMQKRFNANFSQLKAGNKIYWIDESNKARSPVVFIVVKVLDKKVIVAIDDFGSETYLLMGHGTFFHTKTEAANYFGKIYFIRELENLVALFESDAGDDDDSDCDGEVELGLYEAKLRAVQKITDQTYAKLEKILYAEYNS